MHPLLLIEPSKIEHLQSDLRNKNNLNDVCSAQCLLMLMIGRSATWYGSPTLTAITDKITVENFCTAINHTLTPQVDVTECSINIPLYTILSAVLIASTINYGVKKRLVDNKTLLPLLVSVIERFLFASSLSQQSIHESTPGLNSYTSRSEEYSVVNAEDVSLSIEIILQNSFYYKDHVELCTSYTTPDFGLNYTLRRLLSLPKSLVKLTTSHELCANNLLTRLQLGYLRTLDPTISNTFAVIDALSRKNNPLDLSDARNAFLNYVMSDPANKLILDLATDLRVNGIEPILFKVDDDDIQSTALSIYSCNVFVNCISSEFEYSSYCRIQHTRANELRITGSMTIVTLILDSDLATGRAVTAGSSPRESSQKRTSWLDDILAAGTWVPMTRQDQVRTAREHIMEIISTSQNADTTHAADSDSDFMGLGLGRGVTAGLPPREPSTPTAVASTAVGGRLTPPVNISSSSPVSSSTVRSSVPGTSAERRPVRSPCVSFYTPTKGDGSPPSVRPKPSTPTPNNTESSQDEAANFFLLTLDQNLSTSMPTTTPGTTPTLASSGGTATGLPSAKGSSESLPILSLESAWRYLNEPLHLSDPKSMATLISDLGITSASDLMQCDTELLKKMAALFKPQQRKSFSRSVEAATGIKKDLLCELQL